VSRTDLLVRPLFAAAEIVSHDTSNILNQSMKSHALILTAALILFSVTTPADEFALNPQVKKVVDDVSEDRIKAIIQHLVTFGTRNTMSNPDLPDRGVGAARQWILREMKSYSPRLQVRFDKWHIKKNGQRIFKDIDLYNVVAVLPGKTMPETQVFVSGHYDSLNLGAQRPGAAAAGPGSDAAPAVIGERPTQSNWEANAELPAPGACDDGSGTAATMELARVMSQYEFDKTLVFIAFAGEEQGLVGSTLEATKAKEEIRSRLKPFLITTSSEPISAAMAVVTVAVSLSTVTQSRILPRRISPATPSSWASAICLQ